MIVIILLYELIFVSVTDDAQAHQPKSNPNANQTIFHTDPYKCIYKHK